MSDLRRTKRAPSSTASRDADQQLLFVTVRTALQLSNALSEAIGYINPSRPALVAELRTHQDAINAAIRRTLTVRALGER